MSIAAWIVSAHIEIEAAKSEIAYGVLMRAYESSKISYPNYGNPDDLNRFKSQPDLVSFLRNVFYEVDKADESIYITGGDIDVLNNSVIELFETLAPYINDGGYMNIENEEDEQCRIDFKDGAISYSGDAC